MRILSDEKRFNEAYADRRGARRSARCRRRRFFAARRRLSGDEAPRRGRRRLWPGGRAWPRRRASRTSCGRCSCCRRARSRRRNRWPEAKQALQQALAIAPDQPLLLNFLGYAKLERGEDMDAAEAMIRKASELAPDDASITDSLGWAQFKRGKVAEAIATLQRAAEKDPDQAEIQEHLGDALVHVGPAVRGALRLERGAGHRRGRRRRAGQGQARRRPDAGQRRALTPAREIAPAKLNLALHVRGQAARRAACDRDDLRLLHRRRPAERRAGRRACRSTVTGPFAAELSEPEDNLVLQAARALHEAAAMSSGGAAMRLDKACRSRRASAAARPMRRRRCGC